MMNPTIDTLEQFSLQEIFNFVVSSLLNQKLKSFSGELGECIYRFGNLKCAVGFLIPDHLYDPSFEGKTGRYIAIRLRENLGLESLDSEKISLLRDLQYIHDGSTPSDWEEDFRQLAKKYNLEYLQGEV